MTRLFLLAVLFSVAAVGSAPAMEYYTDPVYEKLAPEDSHPMDDMIAEATAGDARAQFILGDLYSKGKGGLPKDDRKAYGWFNTSAKSGYAVSFIRLASLAKRQKKPVDAYKWYTLAMDNLDDHAWHKYAADARNELAESAKLTDEQMADAKKQAKTWTSDTRRELKELEEQKRKAENLKKAAEREAAAAESAAKKEAAKKEAADAAESAAKKEAAKKKNKDGAESAPGNKDGAESTSKSSTKDQTTSPSTTSRPERKLND